MKKGLIALFAIISSVVVLGLFTFSITKEKETEDFHKTFSERYGIYALTIPNDLSFAGEKVPIDQFDVRERFDRELLVNTYWQSQTMLLFKRANRWFPLIESILRKKGVPDDFKYVALIESGLLNVTSPSAAVGYWQFLENTGKGYGLEVNDEVDERYNVERATEAACKYFLEAKNSLGNWTLAAASYNMGITGVRKHIEKQRVKSYYDLWLVDETFRYVFRILAAKEVITHPEKYGYHFRREDLYQPLQTYPVEMDSSINDLVAFAEKHKITYKTLKLVNPWLRQSFITNRARKKYMILIPKVGSVDIGSELIKETEESAVIEKLPAPSKKIEDSIIKHIVKKGESLTFIARKYGVSLDQVIEWNDLKTDQNIKKGQSLIIKVPKK